MLPPVEKWSDSQLCATTLATKITIAYCGPVNAGVKMCLVIFGFINKLCVCLFKSLGYLLNVWHNKKDYDVTNETTNSLVCLRQSLGLVVGSS